MPRKSSWLIVTLGAMLTVCSQAGTVGTVVPIGGQATDIALDEARGVLYIANFTANRIDVMTLATNTIQTSINVASGPSSVALSPDGRFLVIAHYGNVATPSSPTNALTVIDLTSQGKQTFVLGDAPLGVAFGADGLCLVVTTQQFILFDPVLGTTRSIGTISGVVAATLPQPPATFPTQIIAASLAVSSDGATIYGLGGSTGTFTFRYDVPTRTLAPGGVVLSSGTLGPRVVSINADGTLFMAGWIMVSRTGIFLNNFPNRDNDFATGTTVFDSARNLVYGQIPSVKGEAPTLRIAAIDNLQEFSRLNLAENFKGKSLLSSDGNRMYGVSDSGVMILPIGNLNQVPRLTVDKTVVAFRSNVCTRSVTAQQIVITDPGGGNTDFTINSDTAGVSVSPSSGRTPAIVSVNVDPTAFVGKTGTVTATLSFKSIAAANNLPAVKVYVNAPAPEQRGLAFALPGKLVDLLADPKRNRFYILRQDTNEVLVFDGATYNQITTLRTGNVPLSMAISFDQQFLLVGSQESQIVNVFDLETLATTRPILLPSGYIASSIASSARRTLAVGQFFDGTTHFVSLDIAGRGGVQLPNLGVSIQNTIPAADTVITSSSNGGNIFGASSDGTTWLYDANTDTFVATRKDFAALSGSYGASNYNQYAVSNYVLNPSLVPTLTLESASGKSSGFVFIDQGAYRTTVPDPSSAGVIQRVDLKTGAGIGPTRIVEAPQLGGGTTSTGATASVFTRTLAPLASRNAIIDLSVSGFTVLPWQYDASVAPPAVSSIVNAADGTAGIAPGGLFSIYGSQLSPITLATNQIPLPVALANSCLTVNGLSVPMLYASPTQINAQMPFEAVGNVSLILYTPGGTSNVYRLSIQPGAPAVFRAALDPNTIVPTVVRASNGILATPSNPVHRNDTLVIYLTGLGQTSPSGQTGLPAPTDPNHLASALIVPTVSLGGVTLPQYFAGAAPGEVGVNQINVRVPPTTPVGLDVPLVITQGTVTTTLSVRVVE